MQMLMVVFRDMLKEEVIMLLQDCGVRAYTLVEHVAGVGETGMALGSFDAPGLNLLLLTVLSNEQARSSADRLKAFRDGLAAEHPTHRAPIRAFLMPCVQVV